jgi:hypothetical protein
MSSNRQSSIDWLISQLQKAKDFQRVLNQVSQTSSAEVDIIATAREMHRDEIINARVDGDTWSTVIKEMRIVYAENYYNETFNQANQ